VDVVVCDGFTGNVTLKTMEGIAGFAGEVLKGAFQKNLCSRLGYLMSRQSLKEAYRRLDYAEYGGAPLIGLAGVAIVAHGGSNPRAIKNAIRAARDELQQDVNRHISEILGDAEAMFKEEMPQTFWQRLKSKIEHMGEKPETDQPPEVRKRGGQE
jgi:glycerol-3-phosphate acyltransferase PlsX